MPRGSLVAMIYIRKQRRAGDVMRRLVVSLP
jgi:hypothetical protein